MPTTALPKLICHCLATLPQRFDSYSLLPRQFCFEAPELEHVNFPEGMGYELFSDVLSAMKKRTELILENSNLTINGNELKLEVFYEDPVLTRLKIADSALELAYRGVDTADIVEFYREGQRVAVFEATLEQPSLPAMERLRQQFEGAVFGIHGADYNTTPFKVVISAPVKNKSETDNAVSSLEVTSYPGLQGCFDAASGQGSLYLMYKLSNGNRELVREGLERVRWGVDNRDRDYEI